MGRLNIESEPLGEEPDPDRPSFFFVEADGATPITAYDVPRIHSAGTRTIELGYKGSSGRQVGGCRRPVPVEDRELRRGDFGGDAPTSSSTRRAWEPPWARGSGRPCPIRTTPSWPGPWPPWMRPGCRGWCRGTTTARRWTSLPASSPQGAAAIPYGTVSPEQATDPYAMIMSYRNFEDTTIHGLDLSLAWYPADRWRLAGNFSFVDDIFFENLKFLHSEGGADRRPERAEAQGKARGGLRLRQVGTVGWGPGALHRRLPHELGGLRGGGRFLHGAGSQPGIPPAPGAGPGAAGRRKQRPRPALPGVRRRPGGGAAGLRTSWGCGF